MERISKIINRIAEMAVFFIISLMATVVFAEVIFRYALLLPLFWTEEFARYCLVWSSLLGASIALKKGEHIAVTFFLDKLPNEVRVGASLVARISIVALLGVIFLGGLDLVLLTRNQLSPAMRVSMSLPYMAIPVGALIMLFHELTFLCTQLKEMIGNSRLTGRVIRRQIKC
jgi:TRAP-type C4-dicarboxylate transport system permease small subunit